MLQRDRQEDLFIKDNRKKNSFFAKYNIHTYMQTFRHVFKPLQGPFFNLPPGAEMCPQGEVDPQECTLAPRGKVIPGG
jgi:hypothetical protein